MNAAPGDYVVRDTRRVSHDWVNYTVVDMGGRVMHVLLPYAMSTSEHAHAAIRARVIALRSHPSTP